MPVGSLMPLMGSKQTNAGPTSWFMARTYENAFENQPSPTVYYGRNVAFRSAKDASFAERKATLAASFAERKATLFFDNSDLSKRPRPSPPGAHGPVARGDRMGQRMKVEG